jgi:hypothetical protein
MTPVSLTVENDQLRRTYKPERNPLALLTLPLAKGELVGVPTSAC